MYKGISGSAGYGVGQVVIVEEKMPIYIERLVTDQAAEIERFEAATKAFVERTQIMVDTMKEQVGTKHAEILEGHITMLLDPFMQDEIKASIMQGKCAEVAVEAACNLFIEMFASAEDELIKQRMTDLKDLKLRLLKILTHTPDINMSTLPAGTIIVTKDLTPSMTAGIIKENIAGILTEVGGKTSHSAILARALEIPAVLSVENVVSLVKDGMQVAIDGCEGTCLLDVDDQQVEIFEEKKKNYLQKKEALKQFKGKTTVTADGTQVCLYGNIGKPEEVEQIILNDGEGIGLFRTEFLFMGSDHLPTEEEQFEAYKKAVVGMQGKTIIIRTLDVGGDKDIPYLQLEKEDNPFLGFRAIRYCLARQEAYRMQLKAILRASAFGPVKIMVPLVTCVDEIRAVKQIVQELKVELCQAGVTYDDAIQVGVMIETPAASLIADLLAKEADFFSIGTNDLTQYTMAVDRGNAKVAYLYSTYHPAVLRSIKSIIEAGIKAGIMVGMCGEAAADPLLIPLLIAFGLDEYSVSASSILETRATLAKWSKEEAMILAQKVLAVATEQEVVSILKQYAKA